MEAAVIALIFLQIATAVVTRAPISLLLPFCIWPLFYAGLNKGWWGYGVGDGWQTVMASLIVLTFVGVVVGVFIGRTLWPPKRYRRSSRS